MKKHPYWSNSFRSHGDPFQTLVKLWQQTPLFKDIPDRQCRDLCHGLLPRRYQADEYIFRQDEIGIGAVLITQGRIAIRYDGTTLAELEPGDFLGEVALVSEEPRTADAVALVDTELYFLLRPSVDEWMQRSPRHGIVFLRNLSSVLASRLRETNQILSQLKGETFIVGDQ